LAHAYVTFRYRLALHALRQFAASMKSAGEILLLISTHAMIGLFGVSAFPPMYATSRPLAQGLPLFAVHTLIMALPVVLLRKRLLPLDVVRWSHRLPVPPMVQLRADALVAGLIALPVAILYTVSATILLKHGGPWLQPARAIPALLLSLVITYALSIGVLALRSRRIAAGRWHTDRQVADYQPAARGPATLMLWHRLFWLPFWRADNVIGWQQTALFIAALASGVAWMHAPAGIVRGLLALSTAACVILLTDRGDKAVREQSARLEPVLATWPLRVRSVFVCARVLTVLPAIVVLAAIAASGQPQGVWARTAGQVYLAGGILAPLLLVAAPVSNERFRVGLVAVFVLFLTAVGSELW
jgi:hypothetical protein